MSRVDGHASRGIRGRRERRKGRIEDGEAKEAVSDRTRGLLSGSTVAETALRVYPLHVEEVYLRQRDAFFEGTTTTRCGDASLYSPDNGVTLQLHAPVDLVYFSSLTFNHGARGLASVSSTASYYIVDQECDP